MRGGDERTEGMFSYVRPEQRVPKEHPLRPIREILDRALAAMSPRFEALAGQADYLVSGDKDLLVLGHIGGATIVSPADFLGAVKH